jgi:hypothetical protein
MKRLLSFFCLILCSCEDSGRDGLKCLDVIEPSESKLLFSAEGGIDSITAIRDFWLPPFIEIGDTTIYYYSHPPYYKLKGEDDYHDYEGDIQYLVMEKEYLDGKHLDSGDVMYIEGSWFTINRLDDKKIFFSISKNETGKKRDFGINIQNRHCFYGIEVIQSAE